MTETQGVIKYEPLKYIVIMFAFVSKDEKSLPFGIRLSDRVLVLQRQLSFGALPASVWTRPCDPSSVIVKVVRTQKCRCSTRASCRSVVRVIGFVA